MNTFWYFDYLLKAPSFFTIKEEILIIPLICKRLKNRDNRHKSWTVLNLKKRGLLENLMILLGHNVLNNIKNRLYHTPSLYPFEYDNLINHAIIIFLNPNPNPEDLDGLNQSIIDVLSSEPFTPNINIEKRRKEYLPLMYVIESILYNEKNKIGAERKYKLFHALFVSFRSRIDYPKSPIILEMERKRDRCWMIYVCSLVTVIGIILVGCSIGLMYN